LTNIRILREEARQFIEERLSTGSLRAVYINCPDPWPKKKHRKRRLVNRRFVLFLQEYLAPGADFFFATDFDDYGIDVAGMMPGQEGFENCLAPDLYRHELAGYHLSKYMLKFMAEGKKIYFVHYRKIWQLGCQVSAADTVHLALTGVRRGDCTHKCLTEDLPEQVGR
jgi:tRNA (guanine-N7-)-methyltransferase